MKLTHLLCGLACFALMATLARSGEQDPTQSRVERILLCTGVASRSDGELQSVLESISRLAYSKEDHQARKERAMGEVRRLGTPAAYAKHVAPIFRNVLEPEEAEQLEALLDNAVVRKWFEAVRSKQALLDEADKTWNSGLAGAYARHFAGLK